MIDYSFNLKNPLYNVKEVIFLTTEMTILVTLRAKIARFLYYYDAFLAHSCLTSPPRESFCYCILKWSSQSPKSTLGDCQSMISSQVPAVVV